ncbi:MAG: hypothetical protein KatS3mg088_048 [Patescibacteria group bacterium]|nr:MAG: hypothetical protein KatS3mg088_048 [Patescibacteria group bacterium]
MFMSTIANILLLHLKNTLKLLRKRYRWLIAILIFLVLGYLSGFGTGWWWSHGRLSRFPQVGFNSRLLILSPHPDDEVLIAGGLIQRVLKEGGQVKIVYLTTGDSSINSVIKIDKNVKLSPGEFVKLANICHDEAIKATKVLGLNNNNLYFLGFPDQGLREIIARENGDPRGPVVSRTTKLDHVAYSWAYKDGQDYYFDNLMNDLLEIVNSYKPNVVITTHLADSHPDHKAAAEIAEMLKNEVGFGFDLYFALVHYRDYPSLGFIYLPKKLFSDRWFSFELRDYEIDIKKKSLDEYSSQVKGVEKVWYLRFVSSNEIFEI